MLSVPSAFEEAPSYEAMLSHSSRCEKSIECSRPVDRLSALVAYPL
jgi:hypothetical protein